MRRQYRLFFSSVSQKNVKTADLLSPAPFPLPGNETTNRQETKTNSSINSHRNPPPPPRRLRIQRASRQLFWTHVPPSGRRAVLLAVAASQVERRKFVAHRAKRRLLSLTKTGADVVAASHQKGRSGPLSGPGLLDVFLAGFHVLRLLGEHLGALKRQRCFYGNLDLKKSIFKNDGLCLSETEQGDPQL